MIIKGMQFVLPLNPPITHRPAKVRDEKKHRVRNGMAVANNGEQNRSRLSTKMDSSLAVLADWSVSSMSFVHPCPILATRRETQYSCQGLANQ